MPRHSKNNTASAVFTHAERSLLEYGTVRVRLGADSKRATDGCFMCLKTAVRPCCCLSGHIGCKECFLTSILAQKSTIKTAKRAAEDLDTAKMQGEIAATEKKQMDLVRTACELHSLTGETRKTSVPDSPRSPSGARASVQHKNKLSPSSAEPSEKTSQSGGPASGAAPPPPAKSAALPSFWVPSLTPQIDARAAEEQKTATTVAAAKQAVVCRTVFGEHKLRSSDLVDVVLHYTGGAKATLSCRGCVREIRSGSTNYVLRNCGHMLCSKCACQVEKRCTVCDKKCKPRDLIRVASEGTSYSSSGKVMAEKFEVAFQ